MSVSGQKKKNENSRCVTLARKRYQEVHFLRTVVGRVGRPHDIDFVPPAVYPVKNKIDPQEQKQVVVPSHG